MRNTIWATSFILASLVLFNRASADERHHPASAKPEHTHSPRQPQPRKMEHQHGKLEIPSGQPVPTVAVEVIPDEMGGWTLRTNVTNFKFAPERVDQSSLPTEGHAHLYINGKKVTRIYGPWHYLGKLPAGPQSITVTLNTNRHEDLYHNSKRIEATQRILVFPGGAMRH